MESSELKSLWSKKFSNSTNLKVLRMLKAPTPNLRNKKFYDLYKLYKLYELYELYELKDAIGTRYRNSGFNRQKRIA